MIASFSNHSRTVSATKNGLPPHSACTRATRSSDSSSGWQLSRRAISSRVSVSASGARRMLQDLPALAELGQQRFELRVAGAGRGDDRSAAARPVEPSEPDRRASASAAARCRSRSSELLSAHCRSSKLRQTGWRVAISRKNADRARIDVVGLAAEIDLLVRLAGQVLAQLGRDAEQLAAVVVDDRQQPHQRLDGQAGDVGARQVLVGRAAASRRSCSRSSAMSWRMISTNGWNGDEVAVEATPLVDLAAVAARDPLGLLHHAALADPRLAADDDQRRRALVPTSEPLDGRRHRRSTSSIASCSLVRQTKPVTDRTGRIATSDAPETVRPLVDPEIAGDRRAQHAGRVGTPPRLLAEVLHHRVGDRRGDFGVRPRRAAAACR